MSRFRDQLRREKQAYRAQRYRGDLASELLPVARAGWKWRIVAACFAAAAAIAVFWPRPTSPPVSPHAEINVPADSQVGSISVMTDQTFAGGQESVDEPVSFSFDAIPSLPQIGTLWLADSDVDFDETWVPSFPTMEELVESTTQTVEEPS